MSIANLVHLLAAVVWVGGMFFAYMALRPVAASLLEPPTRLTLWSQVFARFFPWVWLAIGLLLASGLWIIVVGWGGFAAARHYVWTMFGLGLVMMALFLHLYFAPYPRLKRAVEAADWPAGGKALAQIRRIIGINLSIGLVVVCVAAAGRYL
ncbi:MAG: CopD family protein [Chromatiales bacterium]|nr:CopD family protein [Chromatiales bacterium]